MKARADQRRRSCCMRQRLLSGLTLPLQMASLMQTVPDIDGTEVIIERPQTATTISTHCGAKPRPGESEFLPVFLPWSLDPGYRREVPADFKMDAEEAKLAELYGLDAEQIAWRTGEDFPAREC